ncbi:MAG: hypothetical protein ACRD1X_06075 [Vicinamibacteria bacterium]
MGPHPHGLRFRRRIRAGLAPLAQADSFFSSLLVLIVSNHEIAKVLREISAFLELEGVGFKPRAYEKAAEAVEANEEPVAHLFEGGGEKAVATNPGVGKSIAQKIAARIRKKE